MLLSAKMAYTIILFVFKNPISFAWEHNFYIHIVSYKYYGFYDDC